MKTENQETQEASELEWLKFFYLEADFGPGDGDARHYLKERFMAKTGKNLPYGYCEE